MWRKTFLDECLYVLETLGAVYGIDAEAREQGLSWEARLCSFTFRRREWSVDGGFAEVMTEQFNGATRRSRTRDWAKP